MRVLLPCLLVLCGCGAPPPPLATPSTRPAVAPRGPRDEALAAPQASASPVLADLSVDVGVDPHEAYRAFTEEIGAWWDHHFKERPYLLRMEARPGGRFVELFDGEGNGAEHARVLLAEAGKTLRFVGPMGLSGQAVELVHTLSFVPAEGGGTHLSLHVEVLGALDGKARDAVKQAWVHFLGRYREHVAARKPRSGPAGFLQTPALAPEKVGLGFFSHASRGKARNHVHADDFAIEAPARLAGLRFWGHVEGRATHDLENISDFVVRIHAGTPEGAPGPILYEQLFPLEKTRPRPTGRRATVQGKQGAIEYTHEVTFATPPSLAAHATYFLSIAAYRKRPDGEAWQWSDAELRNARSYSHPLEDPTWQGIDDTDSAFELVLSP